MLVVHGTVPPLSVRAPRPPADVGAGNREIRP
ncbi:hypothetical protein FBY35_4246 [Streptomyces sp. SLBN-118]|nr:hypothetical protein FBY35_4246 [Streptomyces sp. SLBN-118]